MHDLEEAIAAGQIVKCKPWGKDQGGFVLVNASDFDPAFHVRLDAKEEGENRKSGVKPRKAKEV